MKAMPLPEFIAHVAGLVVSGEGINRLIVRVGGTDPVRVERGGQSFGYGGYSASWRVVHVDGEAPSVTPDGDESNQFTWSSFSRLESVHNALVSQERGDCIGEGRDWSWVTLIVEAPILDMIVDEALTMLHSMDEAALAACAKWAGYLPDSPLDVVFATALGLKRLAYVRRMDEESARLRRLNDLRAAAIEAGELRWRQAALDAARCVCGDEATALRNAHLFLDS